MLFLPSLRKAPSTRLEICNENHCLYFIRYNNFTFPSPQKIYATAVYDNIADSTEELAFRRGDILEVLERDTNGMVGWWLCLLRGRKVIYADDAIIETGAALLQR